jgi:PPOX class probable F420-dependent enzyme
VNVRHLITMSPAEVDAFMQLPNTAAVCTLNRDPTIHAVAMYYGFHAGSFAFHTKAKSQKVRNVLRNPAMTVLVEAGTEYTELRGVQMVGRAHVVDDAAAVHGLADDMRRRYHPDTPDEPGAEQQARLRNRVLVRLEVDRVVSWDHRKLAQGGGPG